MTTTSYFLRVSTLIVLFVFSVNIAKANIIRDSEIEETINAIAAPMARTAGLKDLEIYLIQDPTPNAFTAGGNKIYIFSGMITEFPSIDVIRGVIAHEMGHIIGRHVVRREENAEIYNKIALSSVAIGLLAAAAGNATFESATAIAMGGTHFADRSMMAYSRTYESSADQSAMKLLEKNGYSVQGMMEFFTYMSKKSRGIFINPYDQTHPLSQERIVAIKDHYQKSQFKNSNNPPDITYKFARSAAKLQAFTTTEPQKLLSQNDSSLSQEINDYIKAICYFRIGDLANAIKEINKLIAKKPMDAFYHELKGQILFEFGKKESLDSYSTALRLKPNDSLIKLSRAIVGITIYLKQTSELKKFYPDLKFVSDIEPDNIIALYYLALYYDRLNDRPKSMLYSAVMALKTGDIDRAKALAHKAIKDLPKETPDWYKANDIITMK